MQKTNEQIVLRSSTVTIIGNVMLSAFKLVAGIIARSSAMVSDAVHSLSDMLTTFVVIIGVKLSVRKPDKEHPYGHERMESVAALVLALVLMGTGVFIGWSGLSKIIAGVAGDLPAPGLLALVAAVVSIVVKEAMYWYTRAAAKKTGSSALLAVAWDHRSDVLASAGAFIGILGARIGLPFLDPVASVIISLFIIRVAVNIFRDALSRMTDTSCDEEFEGGLRGLALEQTDVLGVDTIKTRLFGDRIYVDVEISVYGAMSLFEAHNVAQKVHDAIEERYEKVKHCMVHVNPAEDPRR